LKGDNVIWRSGSDSERPQSIGIPVLSPVERRDHQLALAVAVHAVSINVRQAIHRDADADGNRTDGGSGVGILSSRE
jgi:hypothetical protein